MNASTLIGLNTKWYRYEQNITQEKLAELTNMKMAYISTIETGDANLTCKNIDTIAKCLKVKLQDLFNEDTAKLAKNLPSRVDTYYRNKNEK